MTFDISKHLQFSHTFDKLLRKKDKTVPARRKPTGKADCLKVEFGDKIKIASIHPGRLKTELAQQDADIEPFEAAKKIITLWEQNMLTTEGILEPGGELYRW